MVENNAQGVKMKTIILNDNSSKSLYGFRKNVIVLAISLNHKVVCVCPDDGRAEDIRALGAVVEVVDLQRKGNSILNDFKLYKSYVKIFKKYSADLVLNYSIKPNIYGQMACSKLGVKSVCIITGAGYAFMYNNLTSIIARLLYRITLPKATKVWFLNQDDKDDFVRGGYVKLENARLVNGEGVDTTLYKPSYTPHTPLIFAYVGRMLYDKGVAEFVQAVSKIPNVKGVLIGGIDINHSAISQDVIDGWVCDNAIEYWGEQSDMQAVYKKISCLVLPSYREGLSMSVMEAMASGLPVIVSNVRGCKDLVNDGGNGYICEVKSSQSLKNSIEKMCQSDMKKMGACGRQMIEKKYSHLMINMAYRNTFYSL